jgi:hypothetical protein
MKHILFFSLLCSLLIQTSEEHNNPTKTTALLTAGYLHKEQQKNVITEDPFKDCITISRPMTHRFDPELDYVVSQNLYKVEQENPFESVFTEMKPEDFDTCIKNLNELLNTVESKEKKK